MLLGKEMVSIDHGTVALRSELQVYQEHAVTSKWLHLLWLLLV